MSAFKSLEVPTHYEGTPPRLGATPALLERPAWRDGLAAADTVTANARQVASATMGGSPDFFVAASLPPNLGQFQDFPEPDATRVLARAKWQLTAGSAVQAKILHAPTGWTQAWDHEWQTKASGGVVVVSRWTDPEGTTEELISDVSLLGGDDQGDGAEALGKGAAWGEIRHAAIPLIRPAQVDQVPEEAARWSEWPTVELAVLAKGGARLYHVHVAEVPTRHVVSHDILDATLHGYADHEPKEPRIELPGAFGFAEHRFGSHRGMRVSMRQIDRLGPRIAAWSPHAEGNATLEAEEPPPRVIAGVEWEGISGGPMVTGWSTHAPGWSIAAFRARSYRDALATPGAAVLPVRVRARARSISGGTLRFQSSPRAFVELEVPAELDAFTWIETTGYLEAAVSGGDEWPVLVDLARAVDGGTVEIDAWDIAYGEFGPGE